MTNAYHLVTRWRVKASQEEVYDILGQPLEYPRWWPAVYLDAKKTAAGVQFHTKAWLPLTLKWEVCNSQVVPFTRIAFDASGDFVGRGEWSFVQDGEYTDITFEWNLEPSTPMLRYLTPVMRPVFEANHRWAMEQGEISLREELIRYRALTPKDLLDAAEPRGPVEVPVRWLAAAALAVSAIACIALVRRKCRKADPSPA